MRLVQAGSGPIRDLVLVYHLNEKADDDVRDAIGPQACIVNETVPQVDIGFYGAFASSSAAGLATVADTLAWAREEAHEDFELGRLILVGFSAGYIAVRTQLFSGEDPAAIVVADGIQSPRPGDVGAIAPWIAYADQARAGERVFVASHSTQGATKLLSTGETLRLITGFSLLQTGTLASPAVSSEGKLVVLSYMGNDHAAQGYVVLPRLLGTAMALLAAGSGGIRSKWLKVLGVFGVVAVAAGIGVLLARRA
jgi:hypothetical protein